MSSLSRRSFLGLSAAALAGLGLAGCGGGSNGGTVQGNDVTGAEPQSGAPATTSLDQLPLPEAGKIYNNPKDRDQVKDGGTLVLPQPELGPDWNYYSVSGNTTYMMNMWSNYMPINLFVVSPDAGTFTPNPDYLSDYKEEVVNGKEVCTLTFSDKASFNDGTPMDYRAVKAVWTVMNGKDENYTPSATDGYQNIESVEPGSSDKVAVVTFATPYYPAQSILGQVLHPDAANVDTFLNGWAKTPHNEWGAGPFVVDSLDDTQAVFKPNPAWWGNKPKLESITYKQMEDQAEYNAFKNGEIDATSETTGSKETLSNFQGMDNVEIRRGFGKATRVLEVNTTRDVMKDENVRKAFWQCINNETIVSIVYQGVNWKEEVCGSFLINPWMSGYEDNRPDYISANTTQDAQTAAAKKTLEDAGYELGEDGFYAKDGQKVTFGITYFGDSNTSKNIASALQKMAKDAGIDAQLDNRPGSQFSETLTKGDWDVVMFAWSASAASYDNGEQIFGSASESNYTKFGTDEIDQKFRAVTGIEDHADQMKAFNEAEREVLKSNAFIALYNGAAVTATKKGLANYGPSLLATVLPEDIGWAKE